MNNSKEAQQIRKGILFTVNNCGWLYQATSKAKWNDQSSTYPNGYWTIEYISVTLEMKILHISKEAAITILEMA